LELTTEDDYAGPALVNTLGHEIISTLQKEGFLVELVTTIQHVANIVLDNHTIIAEGLADLSSVITIFGTLLPLLKQMQDAHEKRVTNKENVDRPIRIIVEIDDAPLIIEVPDINQADAAILLAQKYHALHPTIVSQITQKSTIKVKGKVPARKRRPRR
jgi:hypothetical protein